MSATNAFHEDLGRLLAEIAINAESVRSLMSASLDHEQLTAASQAVAVVASQIGWLADVCTCALEGRRDAGVSAAIDWHHRGLLGEAVNRIQSGQQS